MKHSRRIQITKGRSKSSKSSKNRRISSRRRVSRIRKGG